MIFLSLSCKESHVGASPLIVGVSGRGKHPLSDCSPGSISTEEIVEDCRINWIDSLLIVVIIVSLDLWALVVVGSVD